MDIPVVPVVVVPVVKPGRGRPKLPPGEAQRRIEQRRNVLKADGYFSNYYDEKGHAIRERSKISYATR